MKIQKTLCYCDRCGCRYELTDLVDPKSKEYVNAPSCDFSLEIQRTRISNNERFRHQFELCSKCANSLLKWLGAETLSEEFKEQIGFDPKEGE